MQPNLDTLTIQPIRPQSADLPIAAVERLEDPANHPEAAALARARIAALTEAGPIIDPNEIPAIPTGELVTDRTVLANQLKPEPGVTEVIRHHIPSKLRPILTAVGVFAIVLLLFKAPVIIDQVKFALAKPAATPAAAVTSVIPAESTITIPKINIHAPIVYEPTVQEAAVQKALESGVDHYGNTPMPGQTGNSVIFGHSSNDWWEPGNYKFVFVLLDKLVPGDRYTVDYQSVRYTYEVTGSRVVEPTDLSVLVQTPEPTMTLITCTPPGTSWKRLVVTAKQVDPAPKAATSAIKPVVNPNLPSTTPSFFKQVGSAWDGVVHGFSSLFGADKTTPTQTPGSLPAVK
jgi:LPXTG-site transpeptidase (sortase) family protein